MAGSARGHKQLAIAASDTLEGGVKGSEGGGTICNRSPTGARTVDPSAGSDGACMMEYDDATVLAAATYVLLPPFQIISHSRNVRESKFYKFDQIYTTK